MSDAAGCRFPKRLRLRKRREFLAVQRGGLRVTTPHFIVYGRQNRRGTPRVGVTVSKKVGKAVVRNRVKRWVREAFRLNRGQVHGSMDLVMVARQGRVPPDFTVVALELIDAARRMPNAARKRGRR